MGITGFFKLAAAEDGGARPSLGITAFFTAVAANSYTDGDHTRGTDGPEDRQHHRPQPGLAEDAGAPLRRSRAVAEDQPERAALPRRHGSDDAEVVHHPELQGDLDSLGGGAKHVTETINNLQRGSSGVTTYPLSHPLEGWHAAITPGGHQVVHRRDPDTKALHVGYAGYNTADAEQRLGGASEGGNALDVHFHNEAEKDFDRLDAKKQDRALETIDRLSRGERHPTDHPLVGGTPLHKGGWRSARVDFLHRIVHRYEDHEGNPAPAEQAHRLHVGFIGPHNYEDAQRRLGAAHPEPGPGPEDYAKQDDENGYDHEARVRRGLSLGHLTYEQARTHGYLGGGDEDTRHDGWGPKPTKPKGWQPLPHTLYHTTTDAAGVSAHGLKSGAELGQNNGHGLGGTPQWLSLTDKAEGAHNMLHSLHEYHDHLNGKTTFADYHRAAQNGEGADRPYDKGLTDGLSDMFSDHHRESALRGKRLEPGFSTYDEAAAKGWTPHPTLHQVFEGNGIKAGTGWEREPTLYERHNEYGAFSRARQWAGGRPSVLFLSNDREAFAKKDPSNFAVLKVRPKPGAQGFPGGDKDEWRTATGDAVQVHGEPLRRTEARIGQVVRPFRVTATGPRPDLPPEQEDALTHPNYMEHRRRSLDLAKNPVPGTHIWRGETRAGHPADEARTSGVGMHWSVNPDALVHPHPPEGHRSVVWHAELEHPEEQAIPRSHPIWGGTHRSMDHEAEVRLRPGARVKLHGAYVWHDGTQPASTPVPLHPERTHPGWTYHPIGEHAEVSHAPGQTHIDYSHFHDLFGGEPHSDAKTPQPWSGGDARRIAEHEHAAGNHYQNHTEGDDPYDSIDWDAPEDHWRGHSNAVMTNDVMRNGLVKPHELSDEDVHDWLRWHPDRAGIEQRHGITRQAAVRPFDADTPVPHNTEPYQHHHDWLPEGHFFGPGKKGLDPRLFDGDRMRPEIRQQILSRLDSFWAPKYGRDWQAWARVYLTGSEASHWYGNGDLDTLIGVDYDLAREMAPKLRDLTDREIDTHLTDELRSGLNDDSATLESDGRKTGPWEETFYVNADSYRIENLRPYAAYDVTNDRWAVRPVEVPDDFSAHSLPEEDWDELDRLRARVEEIAKLPEGEREAQGAALYDELHSARHDAFTEKGSGLYDERNVVWKALDKAPGRPLQQLTDWKKAHDGGASDNEEAA